MSLGIFLMNLLLDFLILLGPKGAICVGAVYVKNKKKIWKAW